MQAVSFLGRLFFLLLNKKMQLVLFDDHSWDNLLPLTFTRPISDLRIGILTISEKWEKDLGMPASPLTRKHLIGKFPCFPDGDSLLINASLLPNEALTSVVLKLEENEALEKDGTLLAVPGGSAPWRCPWLSPRSSCCRPASRLVCAVLFVGKWS